MKRILASVLLTLALAGCNTWERNTFQTLSASKATIDSADSQYKAKAIAQNKCSQTIINGAKAAQLVAMNGFLDYKRVKDAKGDVVSAEAAVNTDLTALVPIVVQVTTLLSNPAAACTGGVN